MPTSSAEFVDRMGGALTQAGLPRLPSLMFSALLVDDDAKMTSAELSSVLEVSPASISGAVRYLVQLGMVRRERERGSRRDLYVVDDDAWHGAMMRTDQLYGPMIAALNAGIRGVHDDSPVRERLMLTREFLLFVDEEMTALEEKWERRRAELARDGSLGS
jgi:DNA-binding transcriptional regulator GbsR (MarR family)